MGTPASPTRITLAAATNFNDILLGPFGVSRPKYSIFTSEVYRIDLYQQGVLGITSGGTITDDIDIIPGVGSSLRGTAQWINDYAYGITYRLLRDSNNNGVLDTSDTLIDNGTPKTNVNGEVVMRNNVSAGIYFVEINDANGNGVSRTQSSLVFDPGFLYETPMRRSDFNGDSRDDLILANQAAGWSGIWTMNGTSPSAWTTLPYAGGALPVGAGDFNNDGKDDLILANQAAGWSGIWTMNGTSPSAWTTLPYAGGAMPV
jgi:hypothetical protein